MALVLLPRAVPEGCLRGGDVTLVTVGCLDTFGVEERMVSMARQLYNEL